MYQSLRESITFRPVGRVERRATLIKQECPARWGGYHPVAVDDTKLYRTSGVVWGTCTFHESATRSPNRAETVRAHNWIVMGDLVPGQPWTFLPHSSRLYFRRNQLSEGETFGGVDDVPCRAKPNPAATRLPIETIDEHRCVSTRTVCCSRYSLDDRAPRHAPTNRTDLMAVSCCCRTMVYERRD